MPHVNRRERSEYYAARRDRLTAAGLCRSCGQKEAKAGIMTCAECAEATRKRQERFRARANDESTERVEKLMRLVGL